MPHLSPYLATLVTAIGLLNTCVHWKLDPLFSFMDSQNLWYSSSPTSPFLSTTTVGSSSSLSSSPSPPPSPSPLGNTFARLASRGRGEKREGPHSCTRDSHQQLLAYCVWFLVADFGLEGLQKRRLLGFDPRDVSSRG